MTTDVLSKLTPEEVQWLHEQKIMTDYRVMFWAKMLINRRLENQGMELPPGVEQDRRSVDLLRMLEDIKKNTNDMPWLSKFVANMFKMGGSQAEQKYPSRKK